MIIGFKLLVFLVTLLLLLPVMVFSLEVLAALLSPLKTPGAQQLSENRKKRGALAVVVPAHDEAAGISATLENIRRQMGPEDRLLVVADNCTDDTAEVATAAGAEVVERQDVARRGKGYALDHGIAHLSRTGAPETVVVIDADCLLAEDALEWLCQASKESGRPVQSLYLMRPSASPALTEQVRLFAWVVKNRARALGMRQLGMPCPLMGTGMAFSWELLQEITLANDCLVEDLKLGLDFIARGKPPVFCEQALVTSTFPLDSQAAEGQRTRWEHGHLSIIGRELPGLLRRAAIQRDTASLFAALDLCVPPLALLCVLMVFWGLILSLLAVLKLAVMPFLLFLSVVGLFAVSVMLAWWYFGRSYLAARSLLGIPRYVAAKIPLYMGYVFNRQKDWVRTKRD